MGFNAMQPGKVKKTDLVIAGIALLVIVGLVLWAVL
jgi:ABC-type nitrate/sulfonate/bicarbonate transport system permease component